MTTPEDIITFRSLLPDHRVAMCTTAAPTGEFHSRPLLTQEVDDAGQCWFVVSKQADWVAGLGADEALNLGYVDDAERTWVSVAGTARIVEDDARLARYRNDTTDDHHRVDDADARLLVVTPTTVEFWDAPAGRIEALKMKASSVVGRARETSGSLRI